MQWALLGVIVIGLIAISGRYPKIAFSTLGALVIGALLMIYFTEDRADISRGKINPEEVIIENPVLTPAYGGSYQFAARLINQNTTALLKEVNISVTMLDCDSDTSATDSSFADCPVIGQSDLRLNVRVPAGQARDVSQNVFFENAQPKGAVEWRFQVNKTRS
ncbi:MAG: hypothetical protein AAF402_06055 [Pseudomonadota bacterium]